MKFYRYVDIQFTDGPHISLDVYEGVKQTPKGWWIVFEGYCAKDLGKKWCWKKWVSDSTYKKFACPSKEEALVSFKARKQRQRRIYEARLDQVRQVLAQLETFKIKEEPPQLLLGA